MAAPSTGSKRRWVISGMGAAVVTLGALMLFRPPRPTLSTTPALGTPKSVIALSPRRSDELAMRDLAPLFLPTQYNAAAKTLPPREPGAAYFERDPGTHLFFDPENPALQLPSPVRPPAKPVDALADPPPPLAAGMGRTDMTIPMLPPNGGHVDVFAADRRESVLGITLEADARPSLAGREVLSWKPLEFVAAVDPAGLVGPLVLTSGSGVEEVDNHFRNYLARTYRIGDRLPPGFYRIVVGP